jgi:RIP metalloprotease RseP
MIDHVKPEGLPQAVALANGEFKRLGSTVANGLGQIFTNFGGVANQLSGPVAIVAQGSEVVRRDVAGLYQFCAIVNLNLALVNTLPLPALDGGYLFLLLLEGLRGKKLPEELEQGVMTSGLLLLMVLGVGLVIKDTINLL